MSAAGPGVKPAVLGAAVLGAAIAGVTSAVSGQLTAAGVGVVTAAGTLFGWAVSYAATERHGRRAVVAIAVIALATGAVGITRYRQAEDHPGVIRFLGGCTPFRVFAQNRWYPYGAAIRSAPSITAKQISNRDPNQSLAVNGWVHGTVAYRTNTPPWNNDIWFHLADGGGWVSFAGVRAAPVSQDPTGQADGGPPALTLPVCQGDAQ
jgi:hypothetical protein